MKLFLATIFVVVLGGIFPTLGVSLLVIICAIVLYWCCVGLTKALKEWQDLQDKSRSTR
jgi:hypothetical protein